MNSGLLDQRITIQQRVAAVDAAGQDNYTWVDFATVWARAEPVRGREFFAASQTQSTIDTKFTLRWREGIDSTMRVLWREVPYDIASPPIDVGGQRVSLELMCVTGVRDGR